MVERTLGKVEEWERSGVDRDSCMYFLAERRTEKKARGGRELSDGKVRDLLIRYFPEIFSIEGRDPISGYKFGEANKVFDRFVQYCRERWRGG